MAKPGPLMQDESAALFPSPAPDGGEKLEVTGQIAPSQLGAKKPELRALCQRKR